MKKISRFEYAIMEIADPDEAKRCQPYTEEEELGQRMEKLKKVSYLLRLNHETTTHEGR